MCTPVYPMPPFDLPQKVERLGELLVKQGGAALLTPDPAKVLLSGFGLEKQYPWLANARWNTRPLASGDPLLGATFLEAVHQLAFSAALVKPTFVDGPLYNAKVKGELQPRRSPGLVFYWNGDTLIVAHVGPK